MSDFASVAGRDSVEAEMPWQARELPGSVYETLANTAGKHGGRPAVSFQILSDPKSKAETVTWSELRDRVTQTANMLRDLGIRENDVVACLMPNCNEMVYALLGGMTAGVVVPINPLLDVTQIVGILDHVGAKVLVTLKSFPKTDVAQKAAQAVAQVPSVGTVIEVDLKRYLTPPKSWAVSVLRPKTNTTHQAKVLSFDQAVAGHRSDALTFEIGESDRRAACFHTGGTTGTPKIVQHSYSGMLYNGWLGHRLLFDEKDVLICPLPLFHVFAAYPVIMSAMFSGAHVVFPTPAGYRGEGVFDNFWALIERWNVSFLITVPTALAALMQRPVAADISSLRMAISGSAPLPVELYRRFKAATGIEVAEGYGLTEVTCLVSCNPMDGMKKVGSVGITMPYTDVRILQCAEDGSIERECATDEIGEICISNPGVIEGGAYTDPEKNAGLMTPDGYFRTGDLGRLDADRYLWITGRIKDIIVRGGHNIDPAVIEQALAGHEAVAFVGAVGQPDAHSGELPCAFVELVQDSTATAEELLSYAQSWVPERAAIPKHIEILPELPKTAVGKIFKPDLRCRAIARVYDQALSSAGCDATVASVVEDPRMGLTAELVGRKNVDESAVVSALAPFTRPWRWKD